MKTNQVMETTDRELEGHIVRQRTKDEFMALNDVLAIGDTIRIKEGKRPINFPNYLLQEGVKDFLKELETEIGKPVYIRGTKSHTGWIHPFFAIKILLHFNPKFEIKVYKWLMDYLIDTRIRGGDTYNNMCGVMFQYTTKQATFSKSIKALAKLIKDLVGVEEWNTATKEQLELRERLMNYIINATRTLKDSKLGVHMGVEMFKSSLQDNLRLRK